MDLSEKFQNILHCICGADVVFEIITDIECDWGIHTVIQCPNCEEIFSIDTRCLAFQDVFQLLKNNFGLYSEKEKFDYISNSHE